MTQIDLSKEIFDYYQQLKDDMDKIRQMLNRCPADLSGLHSQALAAMHGVATLLLLTIATDNEGNQNET